MKFLATLNMPSANGSNPVHQIIFEMPNVNSITLLIDELSAADFIRVRQFYKQHTPDKRTVLEDRGELILNVEHIGKVVEYKEKPYAADDY